MTELTFHSYLPLEHFSLQLQYAKKAMEISNIPLDQALMEFSQYWQRVNNIAILRANKMEWSFDPTTPYWLELRDRVNNCEPADIVAYDLYIRNDNCSENGKEYFSCFRYDFIPQADNEQDIIQIHFKNRDASGKGCLSKERQQIRFQELKLMFESIKKYCPQAKVVQGGSWLYNLSSYQRLFPDTFIANMKVEEVPFPQSSGIWGQFLNNEGSVSETMKHAFSERVKDAKTIEQLLQCFEFRILFPKTQIEDFYNYFRIL